MFGYIRPLPGELKVREFESFKACYCGLCHSLGEKYGTPARFILNFELVFLAMLLWEQDDTPEFGRKRCAASPCRKKSYCKRNAALDACAGYSVILAWWKLKDELADEGFIRTIPHRVALLFLSRAYKKASREFSEFNGRVREKLGELAELEASSGATLDGLADKFALILRAAAPEDIPDIKRRALSELLYHTGRWIYIVDACDDYKADAVSGSFNPIAMKYKPDGSEIPEEGLRRLEATLNHSNNLLCSAFELIPENAWTRIMSNIIYLGMPDICSRVLNGSWRRTRRRYNLDKEWAKNYE